jgi:tRNA pseudouridine38-40 synthase
MVRIIMGTLVDVAFGKFSPDDIERITEARDRKMAGTTAPAQGLYLNKVVYKEQ